MTTRKKLSTEFNHTDLVTSLNKQTTALTEHSEELKNYIIRMGNFVKTIEKPDSTSRNATDLPTTPPSPQLKSMIVEFVETNINPRFFNGPSYIAIGSSPKISRTSLSSGL